MTDTATDALTILTFVCPWRTTGIRLPDQPNVIVDAPCKDAVYPSGQALIDHLLTDHGGPRGWTQASAEREANTQIRAYADAHGPAPMPMDFSVEHYRVVTDIPDDGRSWDTYATRQEVVNAFLLEVGNRIGFGEVVQDLRIRRPTFIGGEYIVATFANDVTVAVETCSCGGEECASA